jgi:hypothetical protein
MTNIEQRLTNELQNQNGVFSPKKRKELLKIFVRRIAFIGDTHVASQFALMPESFTNDKGNVILASPGQKMMLNYFNQYKDKIDELECDTLVHLGDMIHGQNHKELGKDLVTSNLNEQKNMAYELHKPLCVGRKALFVGGSGYHQGAGKNQSPEQDVCERLGGEWFGAVANVKFAPSEKLWHIQHGESAAMVYQATVLERDGNFMKIAEANGDLPHIDCFAKGHWHTWAHLHLDQFHAIQVPCWAAWQPTKFGKLYYGKQPKIGGVICLIDEQGRVTVWPFLYKPIPRIADMITMQ